MLSRFEAESSLKNPAFDAGIESSYINVDPLRVHTWTDYYFRYYPDILEKWSEKN